MNAASPVSGEATTLLRSRLLSGFYPAGSRLPAERVLCDELGISRAALRPAMHILETEGLLVSKGTGGRFVAEEPGSDGSVAALTWLMHHRHDLQALNEVRQLLEPRALSTMPEDQQLLIATQADRLVARQTVAVLAGDYRAAAEIDAEFHNLLTSATSNSPLRELCVQLVAMGRLAGAQVYRVPEQAELSLREHEAIIRSLREGNAEEAAEALRRHHERTGLSIET